MSEEPPFLNDVRSAYEQATTRVVRFAFVVALMLGLGAGIVIGALWL